MPTLKDYTQFDGRYWDTGTIRNVLDYQGVKAPHSGDPYTEAMLLGISGGVTFGYFAFHYDGYDPQVNLLTRNTFEPMQTIIERLNIPIEVLQTSNPDKARQTLMQTIEDGHAPIVYPDMYHLPYNALEADDGMWGAMPVVCYGYEPDEGLAYLSDRAYVPLTVPIEKFDAGRERIKKDKHRLMILEAPDDDRLASAVRLGIQDCIALMTEKPPRGSANSFGLKALKRWAELLTGTNRESWAQTYPTGRPLLSVLMSATYFLSPAFGKTMGADRDLYADFLEEASLILDKPELDNVALRYRIASKAWTGLIHALLPEDVPMFQRAQNAIFMKAELLMEQGDSAIEAMRGCEATQKQLKKDAEKKFPLNEREIADLREEISRHVMRVHDAESEAVRSLKSVMAG